MIRDASGIAASVIAERIRSPRALAERSDIKTT